MTVTPDDTGCILRSKANGETVILDHLAQAARLDALHPGFARAFEFLRRPDLAALPPGRHEVDGDRVFALAGAETGRGRARARLEAHRRYADIQYVVSGNEVMGWRALASCRSTGLGYDASKDIEFFAAEPAIWLPVAPGGFAVFFPEDCHAPLAGDGIIRKVVMKVAVG
jgi:YhcH/YjgK/YiaL family protein